LWRRNRKEQPPTNYRKTRRKQERTLLFLVIFVLVGIGTGLIGLIWGAQAVLTGGLCLLGGAVLIAGMWLLLSLIEKWVGE
jgi:hypothetical protein